MGAIARVIRTSGSMAEGEHWASLADIPLTGKALSAPLKGNSITTFIISGVESMPRSASLAQGMD